MRLARSSMPPERQRWSSSLQSQRNLIVTLSKMRATGRIVLNLNPYSHGLDAIPNLPLEDGDQFVVPVVPATVNVVGAVYDQNSFLYRHGQHVQDYLKMAGGASRNADKRHEFVIRADGSVFSKQTLAGQCCRRSLAANMRTLGIRRGAGQRQQDNSVARANGYGRGVFQFRCGNCRTSVCWVFSV